MKIEISGFPALLTLTFIALKVCHVINWSWLWVLCPFWIPLALFGAVLAFAGLIAVLSAIFEK
jgi:hypothetical protein